MSDSNSQRILSNHIEQMKPRVVGLIDTLFDEISSPARIELATYPQLVQALQTLIKSFADEEQREESQGELVDILKEFNNVR